MLFVFLFYPCVGLRYITEIQSFNDSVKYKCDLCDTEVVKGLIFTHLKGYRHKMAYIVSNLISPEGLDIIQ